MTCTGFATSAKVQDVLLMRQVVSESVGVKSNIRYRKDDQAGAGCSASVSIMVRVRVR